MNAGGQQPVADRGVDRLSANLRRITALEAPISVEGDTLARCVRPLARSRQRGQNGEGTEERASEHGSPVYGSLTGRSRSALHSRTVEP
jgi:hypothetical protein